MAYSNRKKVKVFEITVRFSEEQMPRVQQYVDREGGQRAALFRDIIMEQVDKTLAEMDDDCEIRKRA